jgi:hypothetical protein
LKVFQLQKKTCGYVKKKNIEKNGQVSKISKIMGTQMPAIKKEEKKRRNEKR